LLGLFAIGEGLLGVTSIFLFIWVSVAANSIVYCLWTSPGCRFNMETRCMNTILIIRTLYWLIYAN